MPEHCLFYSVGVRHRHRHHRLHFVKRLYCLNLPISAPSSFPYLILALSPYIIYFHTSYR